MFKMVINDEPVVLGILLSGFHGRLWENLTGDYEPRQGADIISELSLSPLGSGNLDHVSCKITIQP